MACQGLGAVVGALAIGSMGRFRHMGRTLLLVQMILGVLLVGFATSRFLPLSLGFIFASGMFFMATFSISFSLVQLTVPDELRGRVVSIYMVALRGGGPLGGLAAGWLADRYSAPTVMAINGLLLSVVAASLFLSGRGRALRAA
jgi:MFS family permease